MRYRVSGAEACGGTAERGCGRGTGRCPKFPLSPQEQKASLWGSGRGAGAVRREREGRGCLVTREVSLALGARGANSSCAQGKVARLGVSGGILNAGTHLALFDVGFLPCSSANPEKGQALPRKLPVVAWREGEKENNMSSVWHLALFCLLPSWPGSEEGLGTAGAVLRALPGAGSPPLVAPPKETPPSPRGEESKPTKVGSFSNRGPGGRRARRLLLAARSAAAERSPRLGLDLQRAIVGRKC